MSDQVHFKLTLEVDARSEDILAKFCADHLAAIGYNVSPAHAKWEKPQEFCARLGIHTETLRRNACKNNRPVVIIHRSQTGRILELLSNTDFDAFCLRHKK